MSGAKVALGDLETLELLLGLCLLFFWQPDRTEGCTSVMVGDLEDARDRQVKELFILYDL